MTEDGKGNAAGYGPSEELRRSLMALALEVPERVWQDVNAMAQAVLAEVERLTRDRAAALSGLLEVADERDELLREHEEAVALVERLTGERDEWKRESELRGLPKELMQRLHRSEAEVGRLSGLVAAAEKLVAAKDARYEFQSSEAWAHRHDKNHAWEGLRAALAALREDGEGFPEGFVWSEVEGRPVYSPQRGDASGEDGDAADLVGSQSVATDAPRCTCKWGASGSHDEGCICREDGEAG